MGSGSANGTNEDAGIVKFLFWKKTIIRGDLIELYKLLTSKENGKKQLFLNVSRLHRTEKIWEVTTKKTIRFQEQIKLQEIISSQRSIIEWNRFPRKVLNRFLNGCFDFIFS